MPSMRGILMSRMARSGGEVLKPFERGRAIGVGHDPIAFGLKRDRDRGQNIPVVVDESDGRHEPCSP